MEFLKEYRQIKNNYRNLKILDGFINWFEFKTKPIKNLLNFIPQTGKILDLGCGLGLVSYFLAFRNPELKIIAVDPSGSRIEKAKNVLRMPENLKFIHGEIEDTTENNFDSILLIDVLYLLSREDLIKVLKSCHKKSKAGGVLIVKEMNKDHLLRYLLTILLSFLITAVFSLLGSNAAGLRKKNPRYYSSEDFKKILETIGWNVKKIDIPAKFFIYPHIIYLCRK